MHKIKILVLVALCVTLFSGNAVAEVIYHELFAGDGTSSIAHVSWNYYVQWLPYQIYSETGTDEWGNVLYGTWAIGNVGTSGGVDAGIGSVNSSPVVPDADDNGVYYSGGGYMNSLTYTAEYEIDMSVWTDLVLSFDHLNDAATEYRAALAIAPDLVTNPTWYLSDLTVAAAAATEWDQPRVVIDTSASTGWYELDLDEINIGASTTLPASGYIRGFGIQHLGQTGSQRYDNFMVEAVPEPATMALLSIGSLIVFHRRRKMNK